MARTSRALLFSFGFLFSLICLTTSALASDKGSIPRLKEVLAAAPKATQPYEFYKTKSGAKYFVTSFGPCACPTDKLIAICVKDLRAQLKDSLKQRSEDTKVQCPPNAGCTMGLRQVYVECPKGATDSLAND